MARAFGEDNVAKNFDAVSLSRRTVTHRISEIHDHIEGKLKHVMQDCKYFPLALDASTDVTDVSQLLIFARTVNSSFEMHEELLKMVSLHNTTKGTDIFNAVHSVVDDYGGFCKLICCYGWCPCDAGKTHGIRRAPPTERSELPDPALHHPSGDYKFWDFK